MTQKNLILGMATGTALLLATACSKQEPSTTPATSSSSGSATQVAGKNLPVAKAEETPQTTAVKPVTPDTAIPPTSVKTASVAAAVEPATNAVAVQPQNPAADQQVAMTAVASATNTATTLASTLRKTLQSQESSLARGATNQAQGVAAVMTNGYQALAQEATNRLLAALGMTNQVSSTATNQVQALLEKAKALSANQKYQEALGALTELYETKLTSEQKQQADALKAQIQSAVTEKAASTATSVMGNIFGGKKQ